MTDIYRGAIHVDILYAQSAILLDAMISFAQTAMTTIEPGHNEGRLQLQLQLQLQL